jgi:pimeloyl-ACP methyl ester carboxylesterase
MMVIEKQYSEELVYTECSDGVILAGLMIRPAGVPPKPLALVWIPGFSINFYHPTFVPIGRELAKYGYTTALCNHRGHDLGANLWRWQADRQSLVRNRGGGIWELFDDSKLDIAGWIDFTTRQGFEQVVLLGHSYGAKKVAYYQVQQQDPRLAGLVIASTGVGTRSLDPQLAAMAQELVAQGRGQELLPWGSFTFYAGVMSAQTYLAVAPDLHGMQKPEAEIAKIGCPLLICCGTNEGDDAAESKRVILNHELVQRKATGARNVDLVLIEGANHGYDNHERQVAATLAGWMDRLRAG